MPIWFLIFEMHLVVEKLADCLMKVMYERQIGKCLDLDGDFASLLFCTDQRLCAKVNVESCIFRKDSIGVVGDDPAFFFECDSYVIVIEVFRHNATKVVLFSQRCA